MITYKAPLRDMQFVMQDLLNFEKHYQSLPACDEVNQELIDAILGEASKFSEEVVAPLNAVGDEAGCEMLDDGEVRTPPGFKEAYQQFVEGGWPSLDQPSRYGGQDLPMSIGMSIREMAGTANWSWSMYSGLSHGAMETIDTHGSDEQKAMFMEPLVSGQWTGTMCLTEPQAGSDVGASISKAEPVGEGRYKITGEKIFITFGDHDMTDNVVHLILARLDGAPAGVKGKVMEIAIFSTTLCTPDNVKIIVPNGALFGDTIKNYNGFDTRRVDMVFGISYDDDLLKAKQLLTDVGLDPHRIHPAHLFVPSMTTLRTFHGFQETKDWTPQEAAERFWRGVLTDDEVAAIMNIVQEFDINLYDTMADVAMPQAA